MGEYSLRKLWKNVLGEVALLRPASLILCEHQTHRFLDKIELRYALMALTVHV